MDIREKYIINSEIWTFELKCQKKVRVDLDLNFSCWVGVEQMIFFCPEK